MRLYQQSAIKTLLDENLFLRKLPFHGLYHMATGSGKTLIMAAAILRFYKLGYRRILFLVNSTSILEKTRVNFLSQASNKYLFNPSGIEIDGDKIRIKEVSVFDLNDDIDISIHFTTVQGLHSRLQQSRENEISYDDLSSQKMLIISDEAHHLNVSTKSKANREDAISWESSVMQVLEAQVQNLMLEFTATAELSHPEISNKYRDKILFDYSLKRFRQDGFSKDVQLFYTTSQPFNRAIAACIMSLYREQLFKSNQLYCKSVILLKSNTIAQSRSNYVMFYNRLSTLNKSHLEGVLEELKSQLPFTLSKLNLLVDTSTLIKNLQRAFDENNALIIDSKSDVEDQQILLNTLEDENNRIRLIFAVDKLNEGWDVLNLFDIVRMYDVVSSGKARASKATIAEAQLIGRGSRYYPFKWSELHPDRRKFDHEPLQPMRAAETLLYYTSREVKYIDELHQVLLDQGIIAEEDEAINKSDILKSRRKTFNDIPLSVRNINGELSDVQVTWKPMNKIYEVGIIIQAMDQLNFYRFDHLHAIFPNLKSHTEWIHSDKYLGSVTIGFDMDPSPSISTCVKYLQALSDAINNIL